MYYFIILSSFIYDKARYGFGMGSVWPPLLRKLVANFAIFEIIYNLQKFPNRPYISVYLSRDDVSQWGAKL